MFERLTRLMILVSGIALTACATRESHGPGEGPEFVIVRDYAAFYILGPQQGFGPDATLRTGDRVRLMRKEFGYSRIELPDGRIGYVANEELAPAPPMPEEPEPTPTPAPASQSRSEESYSGPEVRDIPLPELDLDIGQEDLPPSPEETDASPASESQDE